ncbi:MAG: DUF2231 domain-containing protein [Dehalococcoidia bacterium]
MAIAGHPIHPVLIPLPIGLLVGSVVADIAYIVTGWDAMWYDIAFWALIGGVLSALVAAAAGFGDYWLMARHTDARTMTQTHMVLNLAAVALFTVSIVLRLDRGAVDGPRFGAALALSLVAVVMIAVSGWIGGEMSYRKHLGMIPDTVEQRVDETERHLAHR